MRTRRAASPAFVVSILLALACGPVGDAIGGACAKYGIRASLCASQRSRRQYGASASRMPLRPATSVVQDRFTLRRTTSSEPACRCHRAPASPGMTATNARRSPMRGAPRQRAAPALSAAQRATRARSRVGAAALSPRYRPAGAGIPGVAAPPVLVPVHRRPPAIRIIRAARRALRAPSRCFPRSN